MKMPICAAFAAAAFAVAPMSASAVTFSLDLTDTQTLSTPTTLGGGANFSNAIQNEIESRGLVSVAGVNQDVHAIFGQTAFTPVIGVPVPSRVRFTFLGESAGFSNFAFGIAGTTSSPSTPFFTDANSAGDDTGWINITSGANPLALDFGYGTDGGSPGTTDTISNLGTASSAALFFGVSDVTTWRGNDAIVLYFGDNGSDDTASVPKSDFDDFVVVAEVAAIPVPAGVLLIGTAFAAAGAIRRFGRKAGT